MNADPQLYAQYNASDHIKIVLKIADEAALQQLYEKCIETGVAAHIVVDKGFTQIPANTKTVIAIGPARESLLRPIIGHLALL
jgi:PTH2 family peptidyl-tRNA hydrolase